MHQVLNTVLVQVLVNKSQNDIMYLQHFRT